MCHSESRMELPGSCLVSLVECILWALSVSCSSSGGRETTDRTRRTEYTAKMSRMASFMAQWLNGSRILCFPGFLGLPRLRLSASARCRSAEPYIALTPPPPPENSSSFSFRIFFSLRPFYALFFFFLALFSDLFLVSFFSPFFLSPFSSLSLYLHHE